jgi:hypothetical protein
MTPFRRAFAIIVPVAAASMALGTLFGTGCGSDDPAGDGGDASAQNAEALFRQIEPSLVNRCGAKDGVCHIKGVYNGAPKWLAEPDYYASVKAFRGILPVTKDPDDSTLLSQAAHDGPSLDATPDLKAKVREWIAAEVGPQKLPATKPFTVVIGANTIDLKDIDPQLAGSTLELIAARDGSVLTLSGMKILAGPTTNVTIESPFFVQIPKVGRVKVDPKNAGFEGKLEVPAGTRKELFAGGLVLLNVAGDTQLKLVLQAFSTTPGKAPNRECTALDLFRSSAVPAFRTFIDTIPDPQLDAAAFPDGGTPPAACVSCHMGGEDSPDSGVTPTEVVATQAMDLRSLDRDEKTACAQARQWIDFANRENSLLITNPQGKGNAQHPLKGVPSNHPVVEGIRKWVAAEQP